MIRMIRTEFLKYKRYHILWLGIVSVLFSILLTFFQLTGTKNSTVSYTGLSEGVVWNHCSLFLPFTFALITGYSVNREYTDFTLKNILVIPVSRFWLMVAKVLAGYGLVVAESLISFIITFVIGVMIRCPDITAFSCLTSIRQLWIVSTCCYIAILPVVIVAARKQDKFLWGSAFAFVYGICGIFVADRNLRNVYPTTTGLVLAGYPCDEQVAYAPLNSVAVLAAIGVISIILIWVCYNQKD